MKKQGNTCLVDTQSHIHKEQCRTRQNEMAADPVEILKEINTFEIILSGKKRKSPV
jgi:hypothetical protein